jgi:hypothetical protein
MFVQMVKHPLMEGRMERKNHEPAKHGGSYTSDEDFPIYREIFVPNIHCFEKTISFRRDYGSDLIWTSFYISRKPMKMIRSI